MSFAKQFEKTFHLLLPAPFTIAVILTLVVMCLALLFGDLPDDQTRILSVLEMWEHGLWNPSLLVFAMQMMLILVLGHTLALAPVISKLIARITAWSDKPAQAVFLVCFFTILVALFNWGLGLIFGAIMARKTGEHFARLGKEINYALVGAAGYSGLMVWHGGISGSAPIKVSESGHLRSLMSNSWSSDQLGGLPDSLGMQQTVFSQMNLSASIALLIIIPTVFALLAKFKGSGTLRSIATPFKMDLEEEGSIGAEKLDSSPYFGFAFALLILSYCLFVAISSRDGLSFLTLNYLNLLLFGLAVLFHRSFKSFIHGVEQAIGGAAGILIQFPLYFGIMGIMTSSGLISAISDFFIGISGPTTFPIFTFFSAGLVNIFVPSGGGQWAVQGPIVIEAASQLNLSLAKCIMALAYGDQLTNMLQPFWALPLLGITGLKAREILPYTLICMLAGALIFISTLLIF